MTPPKGVVCEILVAFVDDRLRTVMIAPNSEHFELARHLQEYISAALRAIEAGSSTPNSSTH